MAGLLKIFILAFLAVPSCFAETIDLEIVNSKLSKEFRIKALEINIAKDTVTVDFHLEVMPPGMGWKFAFHCVKKWTLSSQGIKHHTKNDYSAIREENRTEALQKAAERGFEEFWQGDVDSDLANFFKQPNHSLLDVVRKLMDCWFQGNAGALRHLRDFNFKTLQSMESMVTGLRDMGSNDRILALVGLLLFPADNKHLRPLHRDLLRFRDGLFPVSNAFKILRELSEKDLKEDFETSLWGNPQKSFLGVKWDSMGPSKVKGNKSSLAFESEWFLEERGHFDFLKLVFTLIKNGVLEFQDDGSPKHFDLALLLIGSGNAFNNGNRLVHQMSKCATTLADQSPK